MKFYKYQAAGNDFVMVNEMDVSYDLNETEIAQICHRRFGVGADGLIFLRKSESYDFEMIYHNSDGNLASMCGNGGRSIVRFASDLGIISNSCRFLAIDGEHFAHVEKDIIRLKMQDVVFPDDFRNSIIETGSPHFIKVVKDINSVDVFKEGSNIRNNKELSVDGCNVNFIEIVNQSEIRQRTYERGVEDETYACGTGAVAGALYNATLTNQNKGEILVKMPGGNLLVAFQKENGRFQSVWLSGPAKLVFTGCVELSK